NPKLFLCKVSSSGIPLGLEVFVNHVTGSNYQASCFDMDGTGYYGYISGGLYSNLYVNGTNYASAGGYTDCMLVRYGNNCIVGIQELDADDLGISGYPNPAT